MVLLQGEPKILRIAEAGPVPVPAFTLVRSEDDKFALRGNLNFGSVQEAEAEASSLLESPWLSTPEGIEAMLT